MLVSFHGKIEDDRCDAYDEHKADRGTDVRWNVGDLECDECGHTELERVQGQVPNDWIPEHLSLQVLHFLLGLLGKLDPSKDKHSDNDYKNQ